MSLTTNLSASPYFDDFDSSKDYYKILFKPATAVQVREMNQLQTILQNQIEEFGDHILKTGTILSGCQFTFQSSMPYVKILDSTDAGGQVNVNDYSGLRAYGATSKAIGKIVHVIPGFEGDGTNLNTLYLSYVDSGLNNSQEAFVEGETLKIYSQQNLLYDIAVAPGGASQGFSNSDTVVILSAIAVQNVVAGDANVSFTVGDVLKDDNTTPTIEVVVYDDPFVDTETNTLIVPIRPQWSDLAPTPDAEKWENIIEGQSVLTNYVTGVECKVVRNVGSGATGRITTTRTGSIASAEITRGGSGYTTLPFVSVYSTTASTLQVQALNLVAEDFRAKVTVASSANFTNPVGYGFGINVTSGKIYQKGYFLNVAGQFTMVDKYSNTPSDVSVGFNTVESIVNVATDSTLSDNAEGYLNFSAPGANRLKLEPVLVTRTVLEEPTDPEYFPLVRFSEGRPFSQNQLTQYNKIGDMIARRSYEESGNYVLDEFKLTTKSTNNIANSDTHFVYVVDPGHAYINGYRIKTDFNYAKSVPKATTTVSEKDQSLDLVYGNYFRVNNVAGIQVFKTAQEVTLYNGAANFYETYDATGGTANSSLFSGATAIGTAKIRSVVHESGVQGTASAVYRIHLFDINIQKSSLKAVRGIYIPEVVSVGGGDGVADVILEQGNEYVLRSLKNVGQEASYTPATYTQYAQLKSSGLKSLVFNINKPTTVNGSAFANTEYVSRNTVVDRQISSTGQITVSGTSFPYLGFLTDAEEDTLIVVPQVTVYAPTFVSGAELIEESSSNTEVVLVANTSAADPAFATNLKEGDFIASSAGIITQVLKVNGQDKITVRPTPVQGAFDGSGLSLSRVFPANVPISLSNRTESTAQISGSNLIISLGTNVTNTFGGSATAISNAFTVTYNENNTNVVSLQAARNKFVRVSSSNFPACLGVPGAFRLRKVYNGTNTGATNITNEFFIENGQKATHWGLSYIDRVPVATTTLAAVILVEFDYVEPVGAGRGGLKTIDSYPINDEVVLSSLGTNFNTLEIPYFKQSNETYLLRECLDFRPICDENVTPVSVASANSAPEVNQTTHKVETFVSAASGLAFPTPQGDITYDVNWYEKREDVIAVNIDGTFIIDVGTRDLQKKNNPNRLDLYKVKVNPYPSIPQSLSEDLKEIYNTRTINKKDSDLLRRKYGLEILPIESQTKGYTMSEIAKLERRIAALEYNQNLSLLEDEVKSLKISSTVDSTLERFKFGFFVDNFENYKYSNRKDPEYNASVYEGVLQPDKTTVPIKLKIGTKSSQFVNGKKVTFKYNRFKLLSQKNATYGPYVEPPKPPEIIEACSFVKSRNQKFIGKTVAALSELQNVWEEFTFIGANDTDGVSRNIVIKFFIPAGNGIAFQVIQSSSAPTSGLAEIGENTVWNSATQNASNLPSDEAFALYQKFYPIINKNGQPINPQNNVWFTNRTTSTLTQTSPSATYTTQIGAGKIVIPYDYTKGKYITVRCIKPSPSFNFEICYPALSAIDPVYDSGATTVTNPPPCPVKGKFVYGACEGTTYITYVQDGNCNVVRGSSEPRSVRCIDTTANTRVTAVTGTTCPTAGTFARQYCDGFTLVTYTYTGTGRSTGRSGTCDVLPTSSQPNNVEVCKYTPPVEPTPIVEPEPDEVEPVDPGTVEVVPDPVLPVIDISVPVVTAPGDSGSTYEVNIGWVDPTGPLPIITTPPSPPPTGPIEREDGERASGGGGNTARAGTRRNGTRRNTTSTRTTTTSTSSSTNPTGEAATGGSRRPVTQGASTGAVRRNVNVNRE